MGTNLQFYAILIIAATSSSFTVINADDSSKSEEHIDKDNSASEITNNQEDTNKGLSMKRSQEEVMFGNQQNQPIGGLVDDLMAMSENGPDNDSANTLASNDSPNEQQSGNQDEADNEMLQNQEELWYKAMPVSNSAMHYLANAQAMKNMPSAAFSGGLYDQEELYRRKRNLRSSLGQMIRKRGVRLPRRLKRNVDMEDLLNLIGGNEQRYYGDEEQQVAPHIFSGRAQTVVGKRHVRKVKVPGRFSGFPETSAPEYRYPYVFQHRGNGILSSGNDLEDNGEGLEGETLEDIDNLMLLPPNARYVDMGMAPYGGRGEDEKDVIQKWLSRHTVPSVYRVQRRSAPYFYPVDYRYMPGYKKRANYMGNRAEGGRFNGGGDDEGGDEGSEFGKWGHVVQVPEAYANPEDIARLYGLANLMAAEGGDMDPSSPRIRRAA